MEHVAQFTAARRDIYLTVRPGETRVGEQAVLLPEWGSVSQFPQVRYVVLGIPESIGPQANWGRPGAEAGWSAFLAKFLNMQSNRFLDGSQVAVAGTVVTEDLQAQVEATDARADRFERWRALVAELDTRVEAAVRALQLPPEVQLLVIGGGHNNVLPVLRALGPGAALANVDPHADFRAPEGRHSGNGFRYAMEEGLLRQYVPVGLHQAYNNEESIRAMEAHPRVYPQWWEAVHTVPEMLAHVEQHLQARDAAYVGLEMDMDGLTQMPSSAYTPEGLSPAQARQWVRSWAKQYPQTRYLHLPEAAPQTDRERDFAGKMLAYLVSDFISSVAMHRDATTTTGTLRRYNRGQNQAPGERSS